MSWNVLLRTALEANLGLLGEAEFGDEVRILKARWMQQDEKARRAAFERAFEQAKTAIDGEGLRALLEHRSFQEAVVTGLLDPLTGFDLQRAVADWEDRLPSSYLLSLRRFFNALEQVLLADKTWGPILERYQALRFRQDVLDTLKQRELDVSPRRVVSKVNAELHGAGAIAQGDRAVAAGTGGMAIGGNVERVVQIVIQELTVQQPPSPAGPAPKDLRAHYLTDLAREANRLPWTIVEQEYAHPERGEALGLAEVYTALDTTELDRVEHEEDLRQYLAQVAHDDRHRIPAQAMVNRERRLVILGDPGAGKSTFVKHMAYTLAQANLVEDAAPWLERLEPWEHGALLPVRIELRALAAYAEETKKAGRQLLLGYLHAYLKGEELDAFWPQLNDAIRDATESLLVLLDGLDEVSATLRPRTVDAVQDFADHYRQHRYVVTCRPYAYVGQPCQLQRFREVTLAPFNAEQIDHFIETWYRQLARRDRLSTQKAERQAQQMQQAVHRSDLWGLAQRPLLLTVMTWLHTFRGQLPQDRTELYANAVDLLLRRWQGRVGEEEGILERLEIPGLKMSDLEAGLYDVGYRAHSKGVEDDTRDGTATADVDEGDLRKWLAPYLGDDWNKAGVFVDYIRNRAGLLIRHKRDAYTFPHRTFQEFMAASHLVGGMQDYPGQAARLVREDLARWQQVFVLAAGHAARTHRLFQAISAVNVLCSDEVRNVKQPDATVYRRAQLAGESLLEIGLIGVQRETAGQVVLRRVQDWLRIAMRADQILPPHRRAEAGNILSQLGDPRFREDAWYLPDDSQLGFVKIPKGPFLMGEGDDQHELNLPTYYIARYPVTVAQFRSFVESSGYEPHDWYSLRNLDNHPVVLVTWYAALAYCKWLTKTLCDWAEVPEPLATLLRKKDWVVTLPSEAEWEKAARGNDGSICPRCRKSNLNHVKYYRDTDIGTKTSAVGCFPNDKSPYGVEELNGNVWEWTRSLWGRELMDPQFEYPYDPSDGRENLEAGDDTLRVLRGGAFNFNSKIGRCTARYKYSPSNLGRSEGFRIVISRVKHWHCTD